MLVSVKVQQIASTQIGEYYYSSLIKNNYTFLAGTIFFLAGLSSGYFLKVNPWIGGISLLLIYPLVTLYEATVFKGSHNLLPFELLIFLVFSLPAILGIIIGKYISKRLTKG